MEIKELFERPIDRELDGVIKADENDDQKVFQELDEYVVTDELQKHFAKFFTAYAKAIDQGTGKMGVWISGFFGSGKSHFLKIISYLLENREVNGRHAIDYFDVDKKIKKPDVIANIKKAETVPSDVILFNIDAKASKQPGEDSILTVFNRVFNEMQGFCGAMPYLADLERNLTEKGKYQEFKDRFQEQNGDTWEEARDDFDFIQDDVVDILSQMGFMSEQAAKNFCEKATTAYQLTIEDFAKRVHDYIEKKGNNHHVIFLIDEVGQYVAQSSDRMLNLQTITEQLGTQCHGKAWVIVTSQQAIDSLTKMDSLYGQDFSKIQGRFDTRLALSSADADMVIKKRILAKKDSVKKTLEALYAENENILGNLFTFTDEAEHKLYADADDFADVYPFVPYQFDLLAKTLNQIRKSGASGKHLSEGERSLLSMFKESAQSHMNEPVGLLMPYYAFYEPLEDFLDHNNRSVISQALRMDPINPHHEENNFNVNVLKTLFLIKGLPTLTANVKNITTLMINTIHVDRLALENKVEKALQILTGQKLIQKNGDTYQFLSDEELTINRQITDIPISAETICRKCGEILYETIYKERKYRYSQLGGRYVFNLLQRINDKDYKVRQGEEIGINILLPDYEGIDSIEAMNMKSMSENDVMVVLPPENREFISEIRNMLQIESFLRANAGTTDPSLQTIWTAKQMEKSERERRAINELEDGLSNSRMFIEGNLLDSKTKDPVKKINEGLEKLVGKIFNKLSYIETAMTATDIETVLKESKAGTLSMEAGQGNEANVLAQDEIAAFVRNNTSQHQYISRKYIEDHFKKSPYGYNEDDIHWLLARLFMRGKIAFHVNSETINRQNRTGKELADYLTKRAYTEKLMIDERKSVPDSYKKAVRNILSEVFQDSLVGNDEDSLMKALKEKARIELKELETYDAQYKLHQTYPGWQIIHQGQRLLQPLQNVGSPLEFFQAAAKREEDLLDFADDYRDVRHFFDKQKDIFDKAEDNYGVYEKSEVYIQDEELKGIAKEIGRILHNPSPYGQIHKLVDLREKFMDKYDAVFQKEMEPVQHSIAFDKNTVLETLKEVPYGESHQQEVKRAFEEFEKKAKDSQDIPGLRSFREQASIKKEDFLRRKMPQWEMEWKRIHGPASAVGETNDHPVKPAPMPKKVKTIFSYEVIPHGSWEIETEADIDKYLEQLKKKLQRELSGGDIVKIQF